MGTDVGFELFDVDSMIDDYRNEILAIRQHFVSPAKMASKYTDLLFMIAPFYHAIFNRVGQLRETEHLNVSYFSVQYKLHRLGVCVTPEIVLGRFKPKTVYKRLKT